MSTGCVGFLNCASLSRTSRQNVPNRAVRAARAADLLGRTDADAPESDAHVHRGRITKQGSRLVRCAVVESVQVLPSTTVVGQFRDRVTARRGHNIRVVAAGRRQLEYVFYALRDHHVRALDHHGSRPARSAA